jgi:GNAT superfamily N-acetyltransferase
VSLVWVREESPVWDADKQRIIGGAPEGAFVLPFMQGDPLPGEWWSVRDRAEGEKDAESAIVGYGRLDISWGGDAEVLLAVDPGHQERGVGSFLLTRLEEEAGARGINYVYNTIRDHEARDLVHDWLVVRGFRGAVDGDLRKRVGSSRAEPVRHAPVTTAYDVRADPGGRAPGHEEQGGYVGVDDHQY